MGLDMYIEKTKKINGMTLNEIIETANYIDYLGRPANYSNSTFHSWCGGNINDVRKDKLDEVKKNIKTRYGTWDTEHEYGYDSISEQVAYWRKANAIHNWFIINCADGVDECQIIEVNKDQLETLLNITKKVKDSCELIDGVVINGYKFKDGKEVPNIEKGKVVKDASVAKELLPTTSGFFFGSTEYDEWYVDDLDNTIKQITNILETTDFDNEYIIYNASW